MAGRAAAVARASAIGSDSSGGIALASSNTGTRSAWTGTDAPRLGCWRTLAPAGSGRSAGSVPVVDAPPATCAYHPDRRAGVSCQRCGRPICPDCMRSASVGFQCPECTGANRSRTYTASDLRARAAPIITQGLVAANLVMFVLTLVSGGNMARARGDLIVDFGLVGLAVGREGLVGVDAGEWYRLVT